ncbi:flagellar biosynthesis anti-sigma factor FlgM [Bacillus sp. PS06]|uniref:flagellar biosynthesis anti-sigma factor FlgM n=1 Tax=Bacillus sp. PS06 TaxID=2764176 RepID=UPI00177DBAC0|nr:flagellar biosynthesis anti-sigma factor FlgM [Bacillus sp. PS06]MBD8071393.1 flagellar biosynthesis anti-sigma factor FlgM [Bacillus sp. PS06]
MKINQTNLTGINPYKKQINKLASTEKTVKTDKVEISSAAKQLQETSAVTVARQEKVEALKQQVQNGTYKVDADKVAKSILNYYFEA